MNANNPDDPDRTQFFDRMVEGHDWDDRTNTFETARRLRLIFDDLLGSVDLRGKSLLDGGPGEGTSRPRHAVAARP